LEEEVAPLHEATPKIGSTLAQSSDRERVSRCRSRLVAGDDDAFADAERQLNDEVDFFDVGRGERQFHECLDLPIESDSSRDRWNRRPDTVTIATACPDSPSTRIFETRAGQRKRNIERAIFYATSRRYRRLEREHRAESRDVN